MVERQNESLRPCGEQQIRQRALRAWCVAHLPEEKSSQQPERRSEGRAYSAPSPLLDAFPAAIVQKFCCPEKTLSQLMGQRRCRPHCLFSEWLPQFHKFGPGIMRKPLLPHVKIRNGDVFRIAFANLLPSQRNRDPRTFPCSRRPRRNRSCPSIVPQIVKKNTAFARRFGHLRQITVRAPVRQGKYHVMCELLHLRPFVIWRDGRNHMQPFAAGGLHE